MKESGLKESTILKDLNSKDPEGKKFVIWMIETFEHNMHFCLVFECMD